MVSEHQLERWMVSEHQSERIDSYWISAERGIVTGYQPKGAITGDSYWISAERVMVLKHQPKG